MKIAIVALRFDAPGGVETNVREVAKRLRAAGDEVAVFASDLYDESTWDRRGNLSRLVEGVPVHRFPVYKRLIPGLTMPLMTGLISALDAWAPDVIHAHSHRYGHVLEAAAVARARSIPLVVSTHYHPADRREPAWKRGLLRGQDFLFGTTAYRTASALVVETRLEGGLVAEFAPREKLRVIPPGIDLEFWTAPPDGEPRALDLPDNFLLYAGRLAPNKGLPTLISAVARLPPTARMPLVLLGPDWGMRSQLELQAKALGIADQVRFLGAVASRAEYRNVFRRARLFVLASEWEAFGLVLLEAMASGVPIVATSVGGVPEVLEDGQVGRLVSYGDVEGLASAIGSLMSDTDGRHELALAGARRVQGLSWDASVALHQQLYASVANG